jgi:ribosomal protein S3AE
LLLVSDAGEVVSKKTTKDKKYTIVAITVTIRRFGPSGSSKKKNIVREQMREVIARINNEIFFDVRYILSNYITSVII